jgi:hypothetical protein
MSHEEDFGRLATITRGSKMIKALEKYVAPAPEAVVSQIRCNLHYFLLMKNLLSKWDYSMLV